MDRSERRTAARQRSFLKGVVQFNNKASTMDCLVREIGASGCRLELSHSLTVPDRFDLYVPQKGTTLRVQVQWRRGDELGVKFLDAAESAEPRGPEVDLAARVRQLESEITSLQGALEELRAELRQAVQRSEPTQAA